MGMPRVREQLGDVHRELHGWATFVDNLARCISKPTLGFELGLLGPPTLPRSHRR